MLGQESIFTITAQLAPMLKLGPAPYGERRIIDILGGTVQGPRLQGKVLPSGTDWQIIRVDGAADIQARYTIETTTGGRILVDSKGLPRARAAGALARGEAVDLASHYFRTLMRFETADPEAAWLNWVLAIARGQREALAVRLDVFEVL